MSTQLKDIAEEMHQKSMAARDWVFQVIRTAIIRGVLPGGMPLRQDEISAQLSVIQDVSTRCFSINIIYCFFPFYSMGC